MNTEDVYELSGLIGRIETTQEMTSDAQVAAKLSLAVEAMKLARTNMIQALKLLGIVGER